MKQRFNKNLVLPVIISVLIYLLAYQIPKIILSYDSLHYMNTYIDTLIPLRSHWIIIYFLAFVQWIYGLYIIAIQETKIGYKLVTTFIVGSLFGFIFFMIYPNGIVRPEIEGNNIFDIGLKFVYSIDNIIDVCPSFHCYCSTLVIIVLLKSKDIKRKTLILNVFFSILVYLSTLFTKQHCLIDVPCGIILAIIAYVTSNYISLDNIYNKLNKLVYKKSSD